MLHGRHPLGVRRRREGGLAHDRSPLQANFLIGWLAREAAGFAGSKTFPEENFSTPRLSDAGAATPSDLAADRQISDRFTLFTSAILLVAAGSTPQRTSSVRNHR